MQEYCRNTDFDGGMSLRLSGEQLQLCCSIALPQPDFSAKVKCALDALVGTPGVFVNAVYSDEGQAGTCSVRLLMDRCIEQEVLLLRDLAATDAATSGQLVQLGVPPAAALLVLALVCNPDQMDLPLAGMQSRVLVHLLQV